MHPVPPIQQCFPGFKMRINRIDLQKLTIGFSAIFTRHRVLQVGEELASVIPVVVILWRIVVTNTKAIIPKPWPPKLGIHLLKITNYSVIETMSAPPP